MKSPNAVQRSEGVVYFERVRTPRFLFEPEVLSLQQNVVSVENPSDVCKGGSRQTSSLSVKR